MSFFLGAGMLFAAFLVVRIGRLWIRRSDGVAEAFGWAEAISLLFTGLAAMGVASLIAATRSEILPAANSAAKTRQRISAFKQCIRMLTR